MWTVKRRHDPDTPKPEELEGHEETPPWFPWVWEWFIDFRPGITWTEIESWSRLTGVRPTGWESRLLIDLDKVRT